MLDKLLPTNATPWEEALARALDTVVTASAGIVAVRGTKIISPPASFLPFLVYEYGLSELRPYVATLYTLLEQGIDWQRIRGTHAAVAKGLSFVGYTAAVEEALARRKFWNSFQLRFPTLPPADLPDMFNVAGVTQLSAPKRSRLRRGVHYYDVGPLETDTTRLDRSLLDAESGVPLWEGGPIWSFGRKVEFVHDLTEAEGTSIDNWIEPVEGGSLKWDQMTFPWTEANFPWSTDGAEARAILMASWFRDRPVYLALSDADGVIGYRLARASRQVAVASGGRVAMGSLTYASSETGKFVYIAGLTGFGDGAGRTATSVALVPNAVRADGVPPGQQWLTPDEIVSGDMIAAKTVNIPLRPTVREEIKFLLRF